MTINEYYVQELQALRILGAEFSEKNPGLSSFLARKGQDPDVERLLEGFSFLTARLRQYMGEELPEVSHTLAQLLWPNYLRPIPSYSILQYSPLLKAGRNKLIPKGEEVQAIHHEDKINCVFRTCYDTEVLPLDITNAQYYTSGENSTIELNFKTNDNVSLQDLTFDSLRLFIGDHEHVSNHLYLYLMNYVKDIEVIVKKETATKTLQSNAISAVGFAEGQNILPAYKNVFHGYTLLQEYFCYADKFHFIDISNLDVLQEFSEELLERSYTFSIKINFTKKLQITKTITKANFQLYCTPIINLFEAEAIPIKKGLEEEYEVIPANMEYRKSEVYQVSKIHGWDSRINKYHKYLPFESFQHTKENTEYYYTRVKLSTDETRTKTYIRFNPASITSKDIYEDDVTISLDIQVTNRDLPSTLSLGDIRSNTSKSTISGVSFKNITVPSKSYIPPIRGDFLWRIISNMSLNYLALDDIQTLRNVLEAYDFIGANDMIQKKQTENILSGLTDISNRTSDMIFKGLPIRGVISELKLNSKKFSTLGEAYLLISVLNEFFSLYCTTNSFHKLEVLVDKKELFIWDARMGKQV
ncbi:MAG: type VI secretion system baseplate subunit TssF [Sulfurovum sp.]|nr:type VI secretion system baseplate subunit TssF [Sulfurovum sp.]